MSTGDGDPAVPETPDQPDSQGSSIGTDGRPVVVNSLINATSPPGMTTSSIASISDAEHHRHSA